MKNLINVRMREIHTPEMSAKKRLVKSIPSQSFIGTLPVLLTVSFRPLPEPTPNFPSTNRHPDANGRLQIADRKSYGRAAVNGTKLPIRLRSTEARDVKGL